MHSMLTFDTYRYDALGRRVFTRSQRLCPSYNLGVDPGADFFVECNLGYVQRHLKDVARSCTERSHACQRTHAAAHV